MGMDLKPVKPTKAAPRDADGGHIWGCYNWNGWGWLRDFLNRHGADTSHMAGCNDGDLIPADVCRAYADVIERELPNLAGDDRRWLTPHVILWRTCGGYEQW